jgi:indolepyruvate ferredoxin oxidoreductase
MTRDVRHQEPLGAMLANIERVTDPSGRVALDAGALAAGLFGDHLPANLLCVGAAYQAGHLPLSAAAIEEAIELNGVAVERNIQAFRYGRLQVADPGRAGEVVARLGQPKGRRARQARRGPPELPANDLEGPTAELVAVRHAELVAYQNRRYADRSWRRWSGWPPLSAPPATAPASWPTPSPT